MQIESRIVTKYELYNIYQTMIQDNLLTGKEGIHNKQYIQLTSKHLTPTPKQLTTNT